MKTLGTILALAVMWLPTSSTAQHTDTLWRGVYLFGQDHVNFDTLKHALHMNVFQTSTGYGGSAEQESLALHNSAGLKVIHQRKLISEKSAAQRMVYQAEEDVDWPEVKRNYFSYRHPEGEIDTMSLKLTRGLGAGYMVKTATPDSWYWVGGGAGSDTLWATYRLKVDTSNATGDSVVHCIVTCTNGNERASQILLKSDFIGTTGYKEFVLTFEPPSSSMNPFAPGTGHILTGGIAQQPCLPCNNIDLQVYWYGQVTTYLDKVVVEDSIAQHLFAGEYDQAIKETAAQFGNLDLHEKFYVVDEPEFGANLAINYVGNLIADTLNEQRAGYVTATYGRFARYLTDAAPAKLMIDPYFITSDVPHPSIVHH
ncbi:MAG TPA: hypothetical protein DGH68_07235 [Bacteroidetes bacterium]|nr:hypothetical protein [Bacteroidota bacterium]